MKAQDLKNSILQMAIKGKLVPQNPEDEPASILLEKIRAEKEKLIRAKKIKRNKNESIIYKENSSYYEKIGNEIKCIDDKIPFEIPDSWEWCKLHNLGQIVGGGTPKTKIDEYWDDGIIPWLTPADMKNINGKYVQRGNRNISQLGLKNSSARLMPKNTIIYSSRAPIGYIAIADNELSTNQGFKSLVPFNSFISNYMYYCLKARTHDIQNRASGTTFKEISGTEFGQTLVPIPPLEEQKRIFKKIEELLPYVKEYGEAEEKLEELNETFPEKIKASILQEAVQGKLVPQNPDDVPAKELLDQIGKEKEQLIKDKKIKRNNKESVIFRDNSHFYEKVGKKGEPVCIDDEIPFEIPDTWEWVRLEHIFEFINGDRGKNYPSKDKLSNSGIPFISAVNLENNRISFDKLLYLSQGQYNLLSRGKLQKNDLIFCLRGSLGKNAIFQLDKGAIASSLVILRRYSTSIFIDYLLKYLNSPLIKTEISKYYNGTAQPNLSAANLKKFFLPIPPLEEQKRIVDKIGQLLKVCEEFNKDQSISEIKSYGTSYIDSKIESKIVSKQGL